MLSVSGGLHPCSWFATPSAGVSRRGSAILKAGSKVLREIDTVSTDKSRCCISGPSRCFSRKRTESKLLIASCYLLVVIFFLLVITSESAQAKRPRVRQHHKNARNPGTSADSNDIGLLDFSDPDFGDISKGIISFGHVVKFDWKSQSTKARTEYEGSTQVPMCGPTVDLPEGCYCKHESAYQFVRCDRVDSSNGLFNNASYPLVTRLVIQDSNFGVITPDTLWGFINITILYFNNSISGITPDAFERQGRLKQLYITNNKQLTKLQTGVFNGLGRLNVLRITGNRLDSFNLNHLSHMPHLGVLSLLNNHIQTLSSTAPLHSLRLLDLKHNLIKHLDQTMFARLTRLEVLNLRDNRIRALHSDVFQHNARLVELDLSGNEITYLSPEIFRKLRSLSTLNLANNPITYLHVDIFVHNRNLTSLNLSGLELENIDVAHFHQLQDLKFIYLKKFQYCSYAPYVRICFPKTDGVSSTEHLLVWPILRLSVWVVAVSTCAANSVVFAWRVISKKEDRVLSLFIKNLSIADFLMGVYLLIVGTLDVAFRDEYNRHARQWMTSWRCTAVGLLAMMSCEVSVLILSLITIERYRCIKTNVRVVTLTVARWCVAGVWATGLLLALYPVLHWPQPSFYSSNGLCFPLHIDDPFTLGWQYSALVFLGINLAAMLLISLLYAWMFVIIRGDRQHARPVTLKRREDSVLAFRFFLIVLTDCLCWIPIIAIKLAALCKVKISPDVYAWVVVFILPINSALNPVIYTLAAPTELRRRIERFLSQIVLCPASLRRLLPNADKLTTPRSSVATGTDVPSMPTEYTLCNETAKL
ncbi:relaxin receptor 1-like isoform X3 [Varroa destructor]|uniref:G-protein coupled receptors family 1 profile domain-containing protein n=1 Tax=Varroa destructor TaxID=109461 RepID=A0A7M7KVI4_VARDE|nr:relaxin receptor 1-like isoform X3 [Varroa destructor]